MYRGGGWRTVEPNKCFFFFNDCFANVSISRRRPTISVDRGLWGRDEDEEIGFTRRIIPECDGWNYNTVVTLFVVPGRVAQPNLMYENTTRILVSWPKPSKPAGPVDYYQLIFAHHSGPTNSPQATNGNSGGGSSSSSSSSPSSAALASSAQLEDPDNYVYHSVCKCFSFFLKNRRFPLEIFGRKNR